ncbi:MAG: hypothetical protein ABIJ11_04975 [Elusimicrobiota bacterium]
MKNIVLLLLIFFCFFFTVSATPKSKHIQNEIKKYEEKSIGVWTYVSSELGKFGEFTRWAKLVIRRNRTYLVYEASPTDDNWGPVYIQGTWSIDTGKYSNTGERYYGIKLSPAKTTRDGSIFFQPFSMIYLYRSFIFQDDTTLIGYPELIEVLIKLEKGDRFPFEE